MPYRSAKQRAYLHIHEPALAARWDKEYGGKVQKKTKSKSRVQNKAIVRRANKKPAKPNSPVARNYKGLSKKLGPKRSY